MKSLFQILWWRNARKGVAGCSRPRFAWGKRPSLAKDLVVQAGLRRQVRAAANTPVGPLISASTFGLLKSNLTFMEALNVKKIG